MLAQRRLGKLLLLLAFAWATPIAYPELCQPDAQNAFKVRLSIKIALKENAYIWDATEEYLFKAVLAYAMRRYLIQETTQLKMLKTEDLDDKYEAATTMENRIPCHTLDLKAGQINGVYAAAYDDRFTPL